VHASKSRRQYPEHVELAGYLLPTAVASTTALGGIWVDCFPYPRRSIVLVRNQQAMKKRRAGTRHAGDE
jgi:hypothetical protein